METGNFRKQNKEARIVSCRDAKSKQMISEKTTQREEPLLQVKKIFSRAAENEKRQNSRASHVFFEKTHFETMESHLYSPAIQ